MKKILCFAIIFLWANTASSQPCSPTQPATWALIGSSSATYGYDTDIFVIGTFNNNQPNSQATVTLKIENLDYTTTYYTYYVNNNYIGNGSAPVSVSFIIPTSCNTSSDPSLIFQLRIVNGDSAPSTGRTKVSVTNIVGGVVDPMYSSFVTSWHW